jgi:chemotaxis regulatin CheY-phosphate phosphatase CheZ
MTSKSAEMTSKVRQELEELTSSIGKMMEIFRQICQPFQESSEKVPSTTKQLERVTQQTEQATNKVLDMVEAITTRESEIADAAARIKQIIPLNTWQTIPNLTELHDKIQANSKANLNDTMVIMEALQFQDITSQQIEHAVCQLEDVDTKLKTLLVATGASKKSVSPENGKKNRAYDPNAMYVAEPHNHQQEVDALISNINKKP